MQSRTMSLIEATTNVFIGWLVALATQWIVFPAVGLQATLAQNLWISGAFTAVSLARSYALRRLFTRWGRGWVIPWGNRLGTGGGAHLPHPRNWQGGIPRHGNAATPANAGHCRCGGAGRAGPTRAQLGLTGTEV